MRGWGGVGGWGRGGGGGGWEGYRTNSRVSAFSMPMYPDRNMSAITDDLASYRVARGTATHCTGLHGRAMLRDARCMSDLSARCMWDGSALEEAKHAACMHTQNAAGASPVPARMWQG